MRAALALAALCLGAWFASAQPTPTPAPAPPPDEDEEPEPATTPVPEVAPAVGLAALDKTRASAVGFDHLVHDRNLVVGGGEAIACATCHPTRGKGELARRPDHASCFGKCHGAPPRRGKGGALAIDARARVCAACHAPADLVRARRGVRLRVSYPPYTIDRDHGMEMSHAKHAASPCGVCHAPMTRPRGARAGAPAAHVRCTGCHDGKKATPAMAACATCHVSAYGAAAGPKLLVPELRATFDHARHAKRAPGASCVACHGALAKTDGTSLPTPKVEACAVGGCHDGKAGFAVTASCTRCHKQAPATLWRVDNEKPPERYSHAKHASRLGTTACTACHRLDRRGEAIMAGHAACADAACHATDFGLRAPRTCISCHAGTEPWRKLAVDQLPRPESEFGARISHDKHGQPCVKCHTLASRDRELRPPRGHATCTTKGCHAATTGPPPRLTVCDGCHQLGMMPERHAQRVGARWSVRARFRHAVHATDPRNGKPLPCAECHDQIATSHSVPDAPTPAKARCAPCHDGTTAFKLTGTGCSRCHGRAAR